MKRIRYLALLLALGFVAASCNVAALDAYLDPGTTPPPTITDPTVATSGSVTASDKGEDLLDINVAGFADALGEAVTSLGASEFTVVEDGTVKGITVERIGGATRAPADIVFVFDTTGSMGGALTSVQDSIIAFADFLDTAGLDVRLGAVTFGDAFDTIDDVVPAAHRGTSLRSDAPPTFDFSERPTFPLSSDIASFKTFIDGDSARGGGDGLENALGSVEFAYDELAWRDGAQKVMILITDICSHTATSFDAAFSGHLNFDHWLPPEVADLLAKLKGNATVHVVAPGADCFTTSGQNTKVLAGPDGTGGVFVDWDFSSFDLTEMPISSATAGGYIITFRGTIDGTEHTIRVVIDDGGDIRGEFTITVTY